ncbi:MAG: hypothetical protein NVS4B1_13610 [Ktedonobacteraceae bacterium]
MSGAHTLNVSCYRLAANVRLIYTENGGIVALCAYPLRVVPLNSTLARLLSLCMEERTCEQLATLLSMPLKRVEALCDSLRWKSLLEAGPIVPPITWPSISIVIPSYNRANELKRCLQALLLLEYPHHLIEILVVDDGSTDTTSTMLYHLTQEAETHNIQLCSVHHTQRQGVAISRNAGAEAATNDFIAFIDSDCIASPTWLTELIPLFQDTRIVAVGGMIRGYERRSILGRYEDTCSSLYMGARPQQVRLGGPLTYLPTANLIIRRAIWQQLGGFAPLSQGEDVDFCRRILLRGAHIRYIPQGIVYHDYRTTLKSFLKTRAAYATAEAALLQRHPTERRILVLPPEQAIFAGIVLGGLWGMLYALWFSKGNRLVVGKQDRGAIGGITGACPCRHAGRPYRRDAHHTPDMPKCAFSFVLLGSLIALLSTLFGTSKRLQKVRQQHVPIPFVTVFKATLRGNLAYTYHLYRHLTRYYTLPLLLLGLLFFPSIILIAIMLCIVVSVDYLRLKPSMNWVEYAMCAILNDCAYEIGVVMGCMRYKTWKPLVPIIKKHT